MPFFLIHNNISDQLSRLVVVVIAVIVVVIVAVYHSNLNICLALFLLFK